MPFWLSFIPFSFYFALQDLALQLTSTCPCSVLAMWVMWPGKQQYKRISTWSLQSLLLQTSTTSPAPPTQQAAPSQSSAAARRLWSQWRLLREAAWVHQAYLLHSTQVRECLCRRWFPSLLMSTPLEILHWKSKSMIRYKMSSQGDINTIYINYMFLRYQFASIFFCSQSFAHRPTWLGRQPAAIMTSLWAGTRVQRVV